MFDKIKNTKLYRRIEMKRSAQDEFAYSRFQLLKQLDRVRKQLKKVRKFEERLEAGFLSPETTKEFSILAEVEREDLLKEIDVLVERFEDYETWNCRAKQAIHTYTIV